MRIRHGSTLQVSDTAGSTWDIDTSTPGGLRIERAVLDYLDPSGNTDATGAATDPVPATPSAQSVTPATRAWADQVAAAMGRRLIGTASVHPEVTLLDPLELAARLTAGIPVRHPLDELTGPFYDTTGLSTWLGVTRQALDARIRSASLLMCPLEDDTRVYPAWQFQPDRTLVPHLSAILKILCPAAVSPWTVATWLRTPSPDWAGEDAVSWLTGGGDPAPVITLARHDAARWMQ